MTPLPTAKRSLSALLRRANHRLAPSHLLHGPDWVILGVNNVCNLHCRMCDVGTGESTSNFYKHMLGARPLQMPLELARRVIDEVARSFPRARIGFAFTEPSVWPHLVAAVRYATERGVATSLTTNGLVLAGLATGLAEAGIGEVVVSMDGPPAIHDRIRGREGAFDRALAGARVLLSQPKRPGVSVFCAVTEWNIGSLGAFLDELEDLPLERVGFMHTVFVSDAAADLHNARFPAYPATPSNTRELHLDAYDLDRLWAEMGAIGARSTAWPVSWSPTIPSRAALEAYYRSAAPIGTRCADAFSNMMVKSDGTVIPSHSRCFPVVAGNLYDQSLADLWNAPTLAKFRSDLRSAGGLFPGCDRCCSAR